VEQPDILIFEGLNVLQLATVEATGAPVPSVVISDFFDFSIFVDAEEPFIEAWYLNRFLHLQRTVFQDPGSYFHHYRNLSLDEATRTAGKIWRDINLRNLRDNILPTRERANLVIRKRADHTVDQIRLRQI
jgi:type I pantothenate kinase